MLLGGDRVHEREHRREHQREHELVDLDVAGDDLLDRREREERRAQEADLGVVELASQREGQQRPRRTPATIETSRAVAMVAPNTRSASDSANGYTHGLLGSSGAVMGAKIGRATSLMPLSR